jgi:predicted membrane chloride channel (bestrophin family)
MGISSTPQDEYRWEELQRIEKTRRSILLWVEEPFWKTLTHWNGTVLRFLVTDGLMWTTMALYVAVRLVARYAKGVPGFLAELGKGNIAVIGGFLSFFMVFYVNQSNKRFFGLYQDSMACKGRIFDVATIVVTVLPREQATRLIRYMNAAHAAGYVGLSKTYPSGSFFRHVNENLGLLTASELSRMKEVDLDAGGSCNRELIAWCMKEIQTAQKKGLLDSELANALRGQILKLRASIGQLYNAKDLPIPFFYVHFICLLTAMYLPLFAVTSAINAGTGKEVYWVADVVAGLVVFLQVVFVIGLRILGQKMSDPYGDDLVDLSVIHYVNFTWTHSNRILNSHFPSEEASPAVENELIQKRKFLGAAWEQDSSSNIETEKSNDSQCGGSMQKTNVLQENQRL